MSSIKLKHASGNGVSITAPSSNPAADRTLELPSDADVVIAKTDSSGNLGIKTATPDSSLGIVGTGSDAATRISITDGSGKANVLGRYGNLSLQTDEANAVAGSLMQFKVDGSEAARIDANLNVGLGTTTPTEKLSIYKYRSYNSDAALYQTIGTNNGAVDNNKVHQWRFGLTGNASSGSSFVFSNLRSQQSTYTEELRLHPDGGISFNGDTAAANALDDYEEGTWTPSNPNGGYTFSNAAGYYTKIGRMVHWFLHAGISLVPNNNSHYEIHGLPYTSSNATHNYGWVGQVVYTANSNDANIANMRALVEINNSYVYFHTVGLGTGARMFNSTFRNGMQGETLIVSGTYMTA